MSLTGAMSQRLWRICMIKLIILIVIAMIMMIIVDQFNDGGGMI